MISVTLDLRPMLVGNSAILGTARGIASEKFLKDIRWTLERELEFGFGKSADKAAKAGIIPHVYKPRDMDQHFNLISSGARSDRLWVIVRKGQSVTRGAATSNFEIIFTKNDLEQPINPRIMLGIDSDIRRFPKGNTLARHIFPSTAWILETRQVISSRAGSTSRHRVSGNPTRKKIVGLSGGKPAFMENYTRSNQYNRKFSKFASNYYRQQFAQGSKIMSSFIPKSQRVANVIKSEVNTNAPPLAMPRMLPGFHITDGAKPYRYKLVPSVIRSSEERMSSIMMSQIRKAVRNSARNVTL